MQHRRYHRWLTTDLPALVRRMSWLGLIAGLWMGCTERGRQTPPPEPSPQPSKASPTATVPSPSATPPATPPAAHPTGPPRSCALKLDRDVHGTMAVSMVLQNRTDQPMTAEVHHPLLFSLEVWADGKKLPLQIPAFDGPVEPRQVTAPPRERVTIPTPVTLRFAPDGKAKTNSPFEWLILSAPTDVSFRAKQVFSDTPDLRCELKARFR